MWFGGPACFLFYPYAYVIYPRIGLHRSPLHLHHAMSFIAASSKTSMRYLQCIDRVAEVFPVCLSPYLITR